MSDDDDAALSSLGQRLLEGVRNLWGETNRLSKVTDRQGMDIEALKRRMEALERQIRGLKIARGKAIARNARLQGYLNEAVSKLDDINRKLN